MYPPLFASDIKENERDESKIDKKLCIELCRVFTCLSCVCVLYLIFFTHVINSEIGTNYSLF
ncbi:MAG: hypothetical protein CMK44_08060 [Porticoccus sp.]|nr:hypothetical protein [Porticoccus sp.]